MSSLFQRIDTVFLTVVDFSASLDWYTTVLGLKVLWRDDAGGYAALKVGETPLTLRRAEDKAAFVPQQACVFNFYAADIVAAHRHLIDAGVRVGEILSDSTVQWFEFDDPDGNCLGVCTF